MSHTTTPKQTFYNQNVPFQIVTPKGVSNTSNTAMGNSTQYSNSITASTSATNTGITRVPSVGGSYFHQRSVSKGNFVPFISPTSASAISASTPASIATFAPVSNIISNTNTTTNNNTGSDNYNGNSVKVRNNCDNNVASCTNNFSTTSSSGNNNLLFNSHAVMTAGNSTSSNTIMLSSSSITSVDNTHYPSHPTNIFNDTTTATNNNNSNSNNNNTDIKNNM